MRTKILCGLLALTLAAGLTACGIKEPPADTTAPSAAAADETRPETEAPTELPTETQPAFDGSRTLAYYAGIYGVGRCTVRIEPKNDDEADVSIVWGDSAFESYEWRMTGFFDPDTYRLTYSDCVKTDVIFAEDGSETRTVLYENGVGRFLLAPDHSMVWQDEQENAGAEMEFVYSPVTAY